MRRILLVALLAITARGVRAEEEGSLLARARAFEAEVRAGVEKVRPTVVSVTATGVPDGVPRNGAGSGVLVSPEGHVLTNDHVAGWADQIWVTLSGRRRLTAKIVGRDPQGDLCLLKVEAAEPLPHVDLSATDTPPAGRYVLAMGNPRGASDDGRAVVTFGIVTGVNALGGGAGNRKLFYGDAIQTDAEVNPGNSGGPLFDLSGRFLGINGRIATLRRTQAPDPEFLPDPESIGRPTSPVTARVAYAIPTSQIRRFLPHLLAGGFVKHGFLGVRTGEAEVRGLSVNFVLPDSAAAIAGIRADDILVAIDGERLTGQARLINIVSSRPAGDPIAVRLIREGAERIVIVTLLPRPEVAE